MDFGERRGGGRRALYLDHLHALAEDTGALLTLYGHLMPGSEAEAADLLDAYL
jgi:hypothetical protein